MSDKKQTALQWFKDVTYPYLDKESKEYVDILFNHALQMERDQIVEAYQAGDGDAYSLQDTKLWGQEFYNERYQGGNNE
jgi:hypothetical protein